MLASLIFSTISCAGSTRRYGRYGNAGAITFLCGGATILVGREMVSVRNPNAGRPVIGTGAAAQAVGLLLMVYALDGMIRAGNPHANERPAFREDVAVPPFVQTPAPMRP